MFPTMIKVKICCESCKSESIIEHEMDENHYFIEHCPFCGSDSIEIDDDCGELYDDEFSS